MEDKQIMDLFFRRSETALTCLREKYGALCLSVARRILPDERDAEECVGDVLLKVWNAIPPERPDSLAAFLSRITRNTALDRFSYNHAGKRSTALTSAFEELEGCLASSFDLEKMAEERNFQRFLNDFLATQSKQNRIYFVRRYWYGDSISDIARQYQVSGEKVKASLFRTRNKLKSALEREGISV